MPSRAYGSRRPHARRRAAPGAAAARSARPNPGGGRSLPAVRSAGGRGSRSPPARQHPGHECLPPAVTCPYVNNAGETVRPRAPPRGARGRQQRGAADRPGRQSRRPGRPDMAGVAPPGPMRSGAGLTRPGPAGAPPIPPSLRSGRLPSCDGPPGGPRGGTSGGGRTNDRGARAAGRVSRPAAPAETGCSALATVTGRPSGLSSPRRAGPKDRRPRMGGPRPTEIRPGGAPGVRFSPLPAAQP
jgi:hypothetical protein